MTLFFLCFLAFSAHSQDYKKITDTKACKESINKHAESTKTIKADFSEKVYSSMLKTPTTGTGSVLYKKKNKIRWEHTKPKTQVILIDGNTFKMKENGKEVKGAGSNKVVKKIQELMIQLFTGEFINEKEFTVEYFESTSNYKLKLVPKNSRMRKYIATIELIFDKKNLNLTQLTMAESETDKMVYVFSNIAVNGEIADSKFTTF